MFKTASGEEIFIIDGHVHNWNATKANQKNMHGEQLINCFYAYHSFLSPKDQLWTREKFDQYGGDQLYQDLFVDGLLAVRDNEVGVHKIHIVRRPQVADAL